MPQRNRQHAEDGRGLRSNADNPSTHTHDPLTRNYYENTFLRIRFRNLEAISCSLSPWQRGHFQRLAREVLTVCRMLAGFESTFFVPEGMHADSANVEEPEDNGQQGS